MTVKELLIQNGYQHRVFKKVNINTKITNKYFIKDNYCISFTKIGKGREIISIYNNWDVIAPNTGTCIIYDIDRKDLNKLLTGNITLEKLLTKKSKTYKNTSELPW